MVEASTSSSLTAKRQKVRQTEGSLACDGAASLDRRLQRRHVFEPFLAVGIVANETPLVLQVRHGGKDADRPDVNIITSLGDCWSIWNAESLVQVFVGAQIPGPITQLAVSTSPDSILASSGSFVYRFVRARVVATYAAPSAALISRFLVIGDTLVVLASPSPDSSSVSFSLQTFSLSMQQLIDSIELPQHATPTALVHPSTYLHKVVIGYANGDVQIWNTRTGNLVHKFDAVSLSTKHCLDAASPAAVISITQTPALDILAITISSNHVLLHDIKHDIAIMTFSLESSLCAAPPSFRTDGRAHTMAVGSSTGDIFIFDLEPHESLVAQKTFDTDEDDVAEDPSSRVNAPRLIHTIRNAHSEVIAGLEFVPGQPLLISSSSDNSIKEWFFEPTSDAKSGAPATSSLSRLLKSRSGHSEPPSIVRWYGEDGRAPLLTAGRDRSVRIGWVGREARGGELSQGSVISKANQLCLPPQTLKLEPATSLSFSLTRSRDWDDILTTHPSSPPRTWLGKDRRMKAAPLMSADKKKKPNEGTTTVGFVSHCGNFGLTGSSSGLVTMWNMQSGRWVRNFDTRPLLEHSTLSAGKAAKQKKIYGKSSKVVGVAADEGNTELAVATAEGGLYIFDFSTSQVLSHQRFHPLASIRASLHATILALIPVGISKPLLLLDLQTRRIVRCFAGLQARVTDVTFSPTLRSVVVGTMDGALSTFDVPSGVMIDRIKLSEVMVSLDWSPDGSMLAGCGTEGKGVYLWSWTSGRGKIVDDVDIEDEAHGTDAEERMMPSVRGPVEDSSLGPDQVADAVDSMQLADEGSVKVYKPSRDPLVLRDVDGQELDRPLVTLTSQPRTKWTTLLNLDFIKARDRPRQPIQKPKMSNAPFFLGSSTAAPLSAVGGATNGTAALNEVAGRLPKTKDGQVRQTLLEQMTRSDLLLSYRSKTEQLLERWHNEHTSGGEAEALGGVDGQVRADNEATSSEALFSAHLLQLSPPQLDLCLRLELTSRTTMALLLEACAERLREGRDFEGLSAIVETLRRIRAEEMLPSIALGGGNKVFEDGVLHAPSEQGVDDAEAVEIRQLRRAWSQWLRALNEANRRVGALLDYNLGTLSFLRGVPVI